MIQPRTAPRNLAVGGSYTHYMPEQPYDWRDDELEAWRANLVTTKKWDHTTQRAWNNMLHCRNAESGMLNRVVFPSYGGLHAEVLAQMPAAVIASGTFTSCPRIALLSHRLSVLIGSVCLPGKKPNLAAMHRMRDDLRSMHKAPGLRALYCNGFEMAGGLRIRLHDGVFDVHLGGNLIIATGACSDVATAAMKRLAMGWACLVRMMIASQLRHAAREFGRTLSTPLEFVLPTTNTGRVDNAITVVGNSPRTATMTMLSSTDCAEEWENRLVVANAILRGAYGSDVLQDAITRAVDAVASDVPLLRPITFAAPSRADTLSKLDTRARQFIKARAGNEPVHIDDEAADTFEVWQDDIAYPYRLATFNSLALAVDFEKSNRKEITMRLRVVTNDTSRRIDYQLQQAATG